MAGVKLVVMYPRPKDVDAFEKVYQKEHVPMAVEKLKGKTKLVATKVTGSPQGTAPFYRIAEVHFPSMDALQACAASDGGKETIGHAMKISSGGPPVIDDRRRRIIQLLTRRGEPLCDFYDNPIQVPVTAL